MNTDDLRSKFNGKITYFDKQIDDDLWTDEYVLALENKILKIINNQKNIDQDFVDIVNDDFWNLI